MTARDPGASPPPRAPQHVAACLVRSHVRRPRYPAKIALCTRARRVAARAIRLGGPALRGIAPWLPCVLVQRALLALLRAPSAPAAVTARAAPRRRLARDPEVAHAHRSEPAAARTEPRGVGAGSAADGAKHAGCGARAGGGGGVGADPGSSAAPF